VRHKAQRFDFTLEPGALRVLVNPAAHV
jgi:hypothetical protein